MAIYIWKCPQCSAKTNVERPMKDYLIPPTQCNHCEFSDFKDEHHVTALEAKPTYILLGETGWHNKEYTRNRSIR